MNVKEMSDIELCKASFYIHMNDSWTESDRRNLSAIRAELELRGVRPNAFTTMEMFGIK